ETADRGQRGSQLVAGVRDEPAHSLLGPVRRRLGFLARVEGRLDLAQHDVQRPPEAADLGAGSRSGTRRSRWPSAMASAVSSISSSGLRLARTAATPTSARMSTMTPPTIMSK